MRGIKGVRLINNFYTIGGLHLKLDCDILLLTKFD